MASRKPGQLLPDEFQGDWNAGWRPRKRDWNDELVRFGADAMRQQIETAHELANAEHRAAGGVG